MASLPRIMVVDHRHEVSRAVHATLNLLEHLAVVTEVPSSQDALLEMQRAPYDVMVTSYKLPEQNGVELARVAADEAPGMSIIVIADIDDPVPDDDALSQAPYTVLVKPLAADRFTKAMRVALGEEVAEPESSAAHVEDFGPVPSIELDELRGVLSALLTDVGAMAIVLMNRNGDLLLEQGAVGYLDREKLASVLTPSFTTMRQVVEVIGGDPWGMYFWDGENFDIFCLSLGLHHFVCLVFEGTAGNRALGAVTIYGKRAIEEMLKVIGPVAFEVHKPAAPLPAPARKGGDARAPRAAAPRAAASAPAASTPRPAVQPAPPEPKRAQPAATAKPTPEPPAPPPAVPIDDTTLAKALNQLNAVDVDAFWDTAAETEEAHVDLGGEDALTFEEALQMGLLPPEMGPEE